MALLKAHPGVSPEELEVRPSAPMGPRPTRRAVLAWTVAAIVVLAGVVAAAIWLISREDTTEPTATTTAVAEAVVAETPTVELTTGDAALLESIATEGRAVPVIPESGDAAILEMVSRRPASTLTELPTGDASGLEVDVPIDTSAPIESLDTGDAQVLEGLSTRLTTP